MAAINRVGRSSYILLAATFGRRIDDRKALRKEALHPLMDTVAKLRLTIHNPGFRPQTLPRSNQWIIFAKAEMLKFHVGTLTFLMTDIEGSTRMWEEFPAAMSRGIVRHESIIHEVVTAHDGYHVVEQGEGDSTLSVFKDATQRRLQRHFGQWQSGRREPIVDPWHERLALVYLGRPSYGKTPAAAR